MKMDSLLVISLYFTKYIVHLADFKLELVNEFIEQIITDDE
jgi:hypothetical protein